MLFVKACRCDRCHYIWPATSSSPERDPGPPTGMRCPRCSSFAVYEGEAQTLNNSGQIELSVEPDQRIPYIASWIEAQDGEACAELHMALDELLDDLHDGLLRDLTEMSLERRLWFVFERCEEYATDELSKCFEKVAKVVSLKGQLDVAS